MENRDKLPPNCDKCNSKRIKISQYYNDYYYCLDCKDGGPLLSEKDIQTDKLLKEFEQMLNDNF